VDHVSKKVTGRICHIRAKSRAGPRFDASQTDAERDGFDNLLLLCPLHHDIVDADPEAYTVERLERMKRDAAKEGETSVISDDVAKEFVRVSDVAAAASVIVSTGQSGGQAAHMIANYLASEPPGRGSWSAKLREKEGDALFELWNLFHEAYGVVSAVASPGGRAPDFKRMTDAQFEEFVATSRYPEFRKDELRQSSDRWKTYHEIEFWQHFVDARRQLTIFHNTLIKQRVILSQPIKDAFVEMDTVMSDAMIKLEIGKDYDIAMRADASRMIVQIQPKILALEVLIHERLHGE